MELQCSPLSGIASQTRECKPPQSTPPLVVSRMTTEAPPVPSICSSRGLIAGSVRTTVQQSPGDFPGFNRNSMVWNVHCSTFKTTYCVTKISASKKKTRVCAASSAIKAVYIDNCMTSGTGDIAMPQRWKDCLGRSKGFLTDGASSAEHAEVCAKNYNPIEQIKAKTCDSTCVIRAHCSGTLDDMYTGPTSRDPVTTTPHTELTKDVPMKPGMQVLARGTNGEWCRDCVVANGKRLSYSEKKKQCPAATNWYQDGCKRFGLMVFKGGDSGKGTLQDRIENDSTLNPTMKLHLEELRRMQETENSLCLAVSNM